MHSAMRNHDAMVMMLGRLRKVHVFTSTAFVILFCRFKKREDLDITCDNIDELELELLSEKECLEAIRYLKQS